MHTLTSDPLYSGAAAPVRDETFIFCGYRAVAQQILDVVAAITVGKRESAAVDSKPKVWAYRYPCIEADGRVFSFKPSLLVHLRQEGGYWAACNEDFDIEAVSQSSEGAIESLGDEIAMLWAHIVSETDDNLTKDARDLKRRLLKRITVEVKNGLA